MRPVTNEAVGPTNLRLRAPPSQAEVATEFEALLLRNMVEALRQSASPDESGKSGESGGQLVEHLIDDALANHLAKAGGIGLASFLDGKTEEPVAVPSTDMQLRLERWVRHQEPTDDPAESLIKPGE